MKTIIVVLLLGFVSTVSAQNKPSVSSPAPLSQIGRYQLHIPGEYIGGAILLDTVTGKTWKRMRYTFDDGESTEDVWEPTGERVDNDDQLLAWITKQKQVHAMKKSSAPKQPTLTPEESQKLEDTPPGKKASKPGEPGCVLDLDLHSPHACKEDK